MTIRWSAAGDTDVGRVRERNEDSFRMDIDAGIFLVADGMGGHAAGEVASALAADAVLSRLREAMSSERGDPARAMVSAFADARTRLEERVRSEPALADMGTTLTAAAIDAGGSLRIGHIGDSRLYLFRDRRLAVLTHDHTWTQQEVDAGRIPIEAARSHPFAHVLTRVLAVEEPSDPDVHAARVMPDDILLLCSDGLHNMLDGIGILRILGSGGSPSDIVRLLIDTANHKGGSDNITAVVVQIAAGGG